MKNNRKALWRLMREYFTVYLPKQRNSSLHTIAACRDTWNLFLRYLSGHKKLPIERIDFPDINRKTVMEFLDHMEREKEWKAATKNHRLSCIRSFFHYASCVEPTLYAYTAELDSIPLKKAVNKSYVVEFISETGIKTLLATPDPKQKTGMRDQFFMSLMYDTAARNCEMLGMKLGDFQAGNNTVYLMGKGAKPRLVPVSVETTALFQEYSKRFHADSSYSEPLFYTVHRHQKTGMSDDNVARFLKKYAAEAREKNPDIPERVHPHIIRRSRAMHLYRSGMPLELLSEFLGHQDPETTLIYAFADTEMKREAIKKASVNQPVIGNDITEKGIWEDDRDVITRLCKGY